MYDFSPGEATLARVRDRHILLAFIGGIAVAICWRGLSPGLDALLEERSGIGVGELSAIAALISVVLRFRNDELLSSADLLAISGTSLAFAVPSKEAASAPLAIVGCLFVFRRDLRLASIGQLLLALAFYEWLGQILFHILSPLVLRAEAFTVYALLSPFGRFTLNGLVIAATNGHAISIGSACSAFHNLSLATLMWLSLIKLETLKLKRSDLWILAAMAAATVALNTVRMALMAQSRPMYEFWHNGSGATIVAVTMLSALIGIFLSGRSLAPAR
jgi:hypothetical protein